jgi:hypothetical protein
MTSQATLSKKSDKTFSSFDDNEPKDVSVINTVGGRDETPLAPRSTSTITERSVDGTLLSTEETDAVGLEIGLTSEDLYVSSNKVGVGTTTPSEKLEVVGNVKATAFIGNGANVANIYKLDANDGSPTGALYVDASGNVGVGTTAPTSKFDIRGAIRIGNCTTCGSVNEGTLRYNSSIKSMQYCDGTTWQNFTKTIIGCIYRWQVWSTYYNGCGWMMGNRAELFGGVAPSQWGDGQYYAYQMSSDKTYQQTFFTNKGYAMYNAMVYAEYWRHYSSTDSRQCAVIFRVKNTTSSAITWTPYFYYCSYTGWSEAASLTLNGANNWTAGNNSTSSTASVSLSIPAQRTSTIIVIAASYEECGCCTSGRAVQLGFYNNSLSLPTGLQFVDDLETATGGWES